MSNKKKKRNGRTTPKGTHPADWKVTDRTRYRTEPCGIPGCGCHLDLPKVCGVFGGPGEGFAYTETATPNLWCSTTTTTGTRTNLGMVNAGLRGLWLTHGVDDLEPGDEFYMPTTMSPGETDQAGWMVFRVTDMRVTAEAVEAFRVNTPTVTVVTMTPVPFTAAEADAFAVQHRGS